MNTSWIVGALGLLALYSPTPQEARLDSRSAKHGRSATFVGAVQKPIAVQLAVEGGSIRVRVTSDTGNFDSLFVMGLFADGEVVKSLRVEWTGEPGRRLGTCEFKDLPAGSYHVTAVGPENKEGRSIEWEPRRVVTTPPSVVEFKVHDAARSDLVFRLHDGATGAADLTGYDWYLEVGEQRRSGHRDDAEAVFLQLPQHRRLRWRIDKPGYQSVIGTEKDFGPEERNKGVLQRIAKVGMRAGWGDVVRVTERDSKKPIQGARVLLDGEAAGVTDDAGLLQVTRPTPPRAIRVEREGWRAQGDDGNRLGGERRSVWLEIEMELLPSNR
jgi:hypothetical protein